MNSRPNRSKSKASGPGARASRPERYVGKMGRSQAVTTFGVGSIYELRTFRNGKATLHSVMIAGLDAWDRFRNDMPIIREDILARVLRVDYFLAPPSQPERSWDESGAVIPAVRFPEVLYCENPKCARVGKVGTEFSEPALGGGPRCNVQKCGGKGVPFRFVVACHDKKDPRHPGHIDDFPYKEWAHREATICESPAIKLETRSERSGLGGLVLKCHACPAPGQSLEDIFFPGAIRDHCAGRRPWLNDAEDRCKRPLQVLQRGASNAYFAVTASAISIPPYSDRLFALVDRALNLALSTSIKSGRTSMEGAVDICRGVAGLDDPDVYSDKQIGDAIGVRLGMTQISLPRTEQEQRQQERNAIVQGRPETPDASDFVAVPVKDLGGFELLGSCFDRVVQLHRLREVRALRGFHRVDSGIGGDAYSMEVAPLSKKRLDWLPAIEVRGEGIYLELRREMVLAWQARPAVARRCALLAANLARACQENGWDIEPPSPQAILVHTFSHLLLKQLSLECGYSGASLRERLYVVDDTNAEGYAGVLIYTASPAADGTLGGLVRQGEPDRLQAMIQSTLESARWCSSDPLCGESKGQGVDALNLSACHACALVGETSCERRNLFLDRGFITGTTDSSDIGFFRDFLEGAGR